MFPESRSKKVNTKISLQNILSNLRQISTFNHDMFNCDYSITCNTIRNLFFSQNTAMCQIRAKQNSLYYKFDSLFLKHTNLFLSLRATGKKSWTKRDSQNQKVGIVGNEWSTQRYILMYSNLWWTEILCRRDRGIPPQRKDI